MKAVIPAAGLGTRFLPYTKAQPKEMIPVVDKPAIQYVVEEAVESGLREILIVTGRGKRAIEDHFDAHFGPESVSPGGQRHPALEDLHRLLERARILYVRQSIPRGLGDAVLHAESFVGGSPFGVLLGDDLTFNPAAAKVLVDGYGRLGASVIALQRVSREEIGRYGMVVGKEVEPGIVRVEDVVEKPSPSEVRSDLATIGRYVLSPGIFDRLRRAAPGKGGEIQLTDAIRSLASSEDVYGILYHGKRYDVGEAAGWLCANLELASRRGDIGPRIADCLARLKA